MSFEDITQGRHYGVILARIKLNVIINKLVKLIEFTNSRFDT